MLVATKGQRCFSCGVLWLCEFLLGVKENEGERNLSRIAMSRDGDTKQNMISCSNSYSYHHAAASENELCRLSLDINKAMAQDNQTVPTKC